MSWLKAVPSGGEDVFDESADELHLQSKEWTSNMKKRVRVKLGSVCFDQTLIWGSWIIRMILVVLCCWCCGQDGYVDGVGAGEEASLQVGFNQGFKEGAAQTVAVGRLKGIIRLVKKTKQVSLTQALTLKWQTPHLHGI